MFEPESRYFNLPTKKRIGPDGREIAFKERRFVPPGESLQLLTEVETSQAERLDQVTARTIGNPEFFWQVADINNTMNPFDLVEEPGTTVRVPVPGTAQG